MAEQARKALAGLPVLKSEIRELIAFEKAALQGIPVYEVKGDRKAKIAWSDYIKAFREMGL